ncbi:MULTISPECIES: hypothetical protein [unclassified Pseudoalteromonas]|uniref:hypothetical protein n=1 Tax=unclassified Pseudoalteromonas TaxID=194690 RepID=UPI0023584AF0|nr:MULTISPECIES: hypothetical protein [unclassified Pseudoalteromonas]MDC9563380.1 hypothetical protein [Pseudoalteromonas sp. GAB2316C]MDC9572138.1 hypothetical protein [Pseudoalteromonas sp. GABNS16A]MDC9583827.1 hypothetical protein [Pseudoalteromonas sp. GABNS16C]MDC9607777.1 hypothetical protein [Pseudoalteromonas sp. GABNS16H]
MTNISYFQHALSREIWFYIETHFYGAKYVAERCAVTIKSLRESVFDGSLDLDYLDHVLFAAGAKFGVSLSEELFVQPDYTVCPGSFRHCKGRQTIRSFISFLNEVSGGGDINDGDFLTTIKFEDRVFVFCHQQSQYTHIIEVHPCCKSRENLETFLEKNLCNYQAQSNLSPLSIKVLETMLLSFDNLINRHDYATTVSNLHYWANHLEVR